MNLQHIASFSVLVSWYQIIIHDDLFEGYNAWSPVHVQQGFAWRKGSVSFGTIDIVDMDVVVEINSGPTIHPEAQRAIVVPFVVDPNSKIYVVASLSRTQIAIPTGEYELLFQHGRRGGMRTMFCVLSFKPKRNPKAAVLLADAELHPLKDLLLHADPA